MTIIEDMPEKDYFAAPAASNSKLSTMKRSPAHCKHEQDNPMETTANMEFGSLVHMIVLKPELFVESYYVAQETDPKPSRKDGVKRIIGALTHDDFDNQFVVTPELNKRTKEGKQEYAEFKESLNGREECSADDLLVAKNYVQYLKHTGNKIIIDQELLTKAEECAQSVLDHPTASKLFTDGKPEVSIFWDDKNTEYPCKARLDWINEKRNLIVDLKTSNDASLAEFSRSISKFGYHRQDAMYSDGYEAVFGKQPAGFVFVVVESKPPYAVAIYTLDEFGQQQGREEYQSLLSLYAQCAKADVWPAYTAKVQTIELPGWHK